MRVLIAHGSKRHGRHGIADQLQDALESAGIVTDVRPASEDVDLDPYDGIIVGGTIHSGHWNRLSRRFVSRHANELRTKPVWLYSCGPLDETARTQNLPPVPQVRDAAIISGARDHITFGGHPDAMGLHSRAGQTDPAEGFYEVQRIRGWAAGIAEQLKAISHRAGPMRAQ